MLNSSFQIRQNSTDRIFFFFFLRSQTPCYLLMFFFFLCSKLCWLSFHLWEERRYNCLCSFTFAASDSSRMRPINPRHMPISWRPVFLKDSAWGKFIWMHPESWKEQETARKREREIEMTKRGGGGRTREKSENIY